METAPRLCVRSNGGYVRLMQVEGKSTRTIWLEPDGWSVGIIDQTRLPHHFVTARLASLEDAVRAISCMQVRGAPLIGATAAYGVCLALRRDPSDAALERACAMLLATRPTAINLKWALDEMSVAVRNRPRQQRPAEAYRRAGAICVPPSGWMPAIRRLMALRSVALRMGTAHS